MSIPRRLLLTLTVAAASLAQGATAQTLDPRLNQGPKPGAEGESVMVSTQLPIVTETALEVLRKGGNAVDAMITATFLQHVADYHQVGHWGTMSGLFYEASTGKYHVISGVATRPLASRCGKGDPSQVAIGGVIRAMDALAKRWGTMSWAEYLAPAIKLAEEGVPMNSFMYGINYHFMQTGSEPTLINNAAAREFFMPDGFLVPVGERWKMPALAEHMRKLAKEGADYMYTGDWGQRFVEEARKNGACVAPEDLAEYTVQWEEPVRFNYGQHSMIGSAPPDTGGAFIGLSFNMLQHFNLSERPHYSESAETLELMTRVFGRAQEETRLGINDPLAMQVPVEVWTSPAYGELAAKLVEQSHRQPGVNFAALGGDGNTPPETMGSDHNIIVDAEGNWFSVLHTMHGGAPNVFIDGVQAWGSAARAMTAGPGRRLILPITSIMVERDGKPWLAMGSPGNPPQPVAQVLTNILDWGMDPVAAAAAPRFWAWRNNEARVDVESRISDEAREGIKASGLKLYDLGPYYWSTGSMQIIWRDAHSGHLRGATDPRRLGWAEGY